MPGADIQPEALQGRRVLIVEDELLVAMELENLLQQSGCTVLGPANSVARAMALLERERPDVVLLDLNLNGEAANPVAATLSRQGLPFVVVSGYSPAQSNAPELAGAPRVGKPGDRHRLLHALSLVVRPSRGN
ncbi:MAG: response regulator [Acetobacterales bacterium]